jgi:hypothetical protein
MEGKLVRLVPWKRFYEWLGTERSGRPQQTAPLRGDTFVIYTKGGVEVAHIEFADAEKASDRVLHASPPLLGLFVIQMYTAYSRDPIRKSSTIVESERIPIPLDHCAIATHDRASETVAQYGAQVTHGKW